MNTIVLIDNNDSFTYNLVDQLKIFKYKVIVFRNYVNFNVIKKKISELKTSIIVLSPGPGIPKNSGLLIPLINFYKGQIPIIGICLGHQALIESYGGSLIYVRNVVHGKKSFITHDNLAMFSSMLNPLPVARYHSLICNNIPKNFVVNSWYKNLVMSVRDDKNYVYGFQFHPESILTVFGSQVLNNTINWIKLIKV